MDWSDINVTLKLGASIVVTVSFAGLAFVYKKEFYEFLKKSRVTLRLYLFGIIDVTIEPLQKLQEQMENAGILQATPGPTQYPGGKQADSSARDAILESWGSLKQIVKAAVVGRGLPFISVSEAPEDVEGLVRAQAITRDIAQAFIVLYKEGKKVSDSQGKKIDKEYAAVYQQLVNSVLDWMMSHVIALPPESPSPKPQSQPTRVGGYFPPPRPGHPTAILVGVRGSVQGQQFSVEKEFFRIGATYDNDLVIASDDYVSGKHAYLRYDKGTLLLADQKSRNGTFLNNNRLTDTALVLNPGDRIRVGNSTMEVVQVPGR